MKIDFRSAALGIVGGLAISAAAAQATQTHGQTHQPSAPKAGQPMQSMDHQRMMADPAMRQQMVERMRQCRDMMSQMMSHMEHPQQAPRQQPRQ